MFQQLQLSHLPINPNHFLVSVLHLEVASTVQCTTPKTKDEKDATKGACAATW